jgi:hypothetical protein
VKAVLRGKFIAKMTTLKKIKFSNKQIHLKEAEKEEKSKSKYVKVKELIRIRTEINEIEASRTLETS